MHGTLPGVLYTLGTIAALVFFGTFALVAHAARRRAGERTAWLIAGAYLLLAVVVVIVPAPSWSGAWLCVVLAAGLAIAAWRIEAVHAAAERTGGDPTLAPQALAVAGPALGLSMIVVVLLIMVSITVSPGLWRP